MGIRFTALGSVDDIGAASYVVEFDGTRLMLDAGIHPREEGLRNLPRFDRAPVDLLDAFLLSHCHLDHLGALPVALRRFSHARVLMTAASSLLAPVMLHHSARLMERLMIEGRAPRPTFTADDVDMISWIFQGMRCEAPFPIDSLDGSGVTLEAELYEAGHILGAAGIHLSGPSGSLFYTGDTSLHDQEILPGARYPEGPVDVLISECTLGADEEAEHRSRSGEIVRFASAVDQVLTGGGSVLVPVFSLGRSQEMLALLHRLREQGHIPDVEIYTAGFGNVVASLYDRTTKDTRRLDPDLRLTDLDVRPLPRPLDRGPHLRFPSVIVVSSGMMAQDTLSYRLAEVMLPRPRHGVFFVGYVDPDMPGHRVLTAEPRERITLAPGTQPVDAKARIERFHFTAHSHRHHLMEVVDRLRPETVVLVHGGPEAADWVQQQIEASHPRTRVVRPGLGEPLDLI